MKNASYTKTKEGDGYVFHVTPAPKVLGGGSGFAFAVIVGYIVGMLVVLTYDWTMGIVAFFVVGCFTLTLDKRKKNHKKPSTFEVSDTQIRTNGRTFNKEDIHRLIVQNAYRDVPEVMVTENNSMARAQYGMQKANERISYSLEVETGGKAYQLAGGMDDTTAFGLLTDVRKILDFKADN